MADSDSDNMPALINSGSESDSEEEEYAITNAESARRWCEKGADWKTDHHHVIKIYALGPFLFATVDQPEHWIKFLVEVGILPSANERSIEFNLEPLSDHSLEMIELVESALDVLCEGMLNRGRTTLYPILELVEEANKHRNKSSDELLSAVSSRPIVQEWKRKVLIPAGILVDDRRVRMALLYAFEEYSRHVWKFTKEGKNRQQLFDRENKNNDRKIEERKNLANGIFGMGKYTEALDEYTQLLHISPFNKKLHGNRAQVRLKSGHLRAAISDSKRSMVVDPYWSKGHLRYATALMDMDKPTSLKRAEAALKKALVFCPRDKEVAEKYDEVKAKLEMLKVDKSLNNGPKTSAGKPKEKTKCTSKEVPNPSSGSEDDCPGLVGSSDEETEAAASASRSNTKDYEGMPPLEADSEEEVPFWDGQEKKSSLPTNPRTGSRKMKEKQGKQIKKKVEQQSRAKENESDKKKERDMADKLDQKTKELRKRNFEQNNNKVQPQQHISEEIVLKRQSQRDLETNMRQGSEALISQQCRNAVWYYQKAIDLVMEHTVQYYSKFEELEYVILLFSVGTACVETGMQKEINEGINWFTRIAEVHQDIRFPLVYLGLGKAYFKQNRFEQALIPLNKGYFVVTNATFDSTLYTYPGTQISINESNPITLKKTFTDYINLCKYPPIPEAVCKSDECDSSKHFSRNIYLCDPDFKGFIRVFCYEKCVIEFHVDCWKLRKSKGKDKISDKDIVNGTGCFTPDCTAPIVRIYIYDHDGQIQKEINYEGDMEALVQKEKRTHTKTKATSKRSLERKEQRRNDRLQKRLQKKLTLENACPGSPDGLHIANQLLASNTAANRENIKPSHEVANDPLDQAGVTVDLHKYVTVLKKSAASPEQMYKPKTSGKAKKKKRRDSAKSGPMPLQEFVANPDDDASSTSSDPTPSNSSTNVSVNNRFSTLDPEYPFKVPEVIRKNIAEFENRAPDDQPKTPAKKSTDYAAAAKKPSPQTKAAASSNSGDPKYLEIKENLFSYFAGILLEEGPLEVDSQRFKDELYEFPEEAKALIEGAGGIGKFLIQSLQFAVVDSYVCLLQDIPKVPDKKKQGLNNSWRTIHSGGSASGTSNLSPSHFPSMNNSNKDIAITKAVAVSISPGHGTPKPSIGSSEGLNFTTIASNIVSSKPHQTNNARDRKSKGAETTPTSSPGRPISSSAVGSSRAKHNKNLPPRFAKANKGQTFTSVSDKTESSLGEALQRLDQKDTGYTPPLLEADTDASKSASVSELFRKQVFAAAGKGLDSDQPKRTDSPGSVSSLGSSTSQSDTPINGEPDKAVTSGRNIYNTGERDVCKFRLEARNVTKHVPTAPSSRIVGESSHSTPTRTPSLDTALPRKSESLPTTPIRMTVLKAEAKQLIKESSKDLWKESGDGGRLWSSSAKSWGDDVDKHFTPPEELREGTEFYENIRPSEQSQSPENMPDTMPQVKSPWAHGRKAVTPPRERGLAKVESIWAPSESPAKWSGSPTPHPGVIGMKSQTRDTSGHVNTMPSIHTDHPKPAPLHSDLLGSGIHVGEVEHSDRDVWGLDRNRPDPDFDRAVDSASRDVAESTRLEIERMNDDFCKEQAQQVYESFKKYPAFAGNPELLQKIINQIKSDLEFSHGSKRHLIPDKLPIGPPISGRTTGKKRNSAVQCNIKIHEMCDAVVNTDPYEPYRERYEMAHREVTLLNQRIQLELDRNTQLININAAHVSNLRKERDDALQDLKKYEEFNNSMARDFESESRKWDQEKKTLKLQMKAADAKEAMAGSRVMESERQLAEVTEALNIEREQRNHERSDLRLRLEDMERRMCEEKARTEKVELALVQQKLDFGITFLDRSLMDTNFKLAHMTNCAASLKKDNKPVPPELHDTIAKWMQAAEEIKRRKVQAITDFEELKRRIRQGESVPDLTKIPPPQPPPAPDGPGSMIRPPFPGPRPMGVMLGAPMRGPVPVPLARNPSPGMPAQRPNSVTNGRGSRSGSSSPVVGASSSPLGLGDNLLTEYAAAMSKAQQSDAQRTISTVGAGRPSNEKAKNSFEKIVISLGKMFPIYNRTEIMKFIQDLRTVNGRLSGLTLSQIVQNVADLILQHQAEAGARPRIAAVGEEIFQEEEDPCIICHEDLPTGAANSLWNCTNCFHRYHIQCIKQWLKEQSTCPTCRKHVLLQDDYPALC